MRSVRCGGKASCRRIRPVTYRFGRFTLDSEARQLLVAGTEVHLSPKAFTLLHLLIEHRQRVIPKEELQERLWPSTFIGETNLSTLAAEVRRTLGESAQHPTWIRTIHRVGYRFVGSVIEGTPVTPPLSGERMFITSADRQFALPDGATIIGRGSDADIQIDAGGVSRHHARILVVDGRASIEDLASKNGTFVGGVRLERAHLLGDGDQIRVGPALITFWIAPAAQATETMTVGPA